MANALARVGHEFQPLVPPRGSVAARVQAAVPGCQVVAAFHHVPAKELGDLDHPIESDVLICSDDKAAGAHGHARSSDKIPDCRPLDAGELSNATPIEAFTAVLLQLNVRYKTRVAPKLTGITRVTLSRSSDAPLRHGPPGGRAVRAGPVVTMYTCGITPYDATHLGHAARLRHLRRAAAAPARPRPRDHCVRNITDVDDPLLRKARELGVHYLDLAAGEMARFDDDMVALDVLPVFAEPRATSAIPDIRGFIGMVLDRGHAYEAGGSVYFDVTTFPRFGDDQPLHRGADARATPPSAAATSTTRTSATRSTSCCGSRRRADEPAWESLWGPGRPGWHIECSALALRELGTTIDLHGGGTDLIFPHHECERAQSEAATGRAVRAPLDAPAMVRMDGEKMSKSLGNLVFVDQLRKEWDPRAIRLAIVEHHYRDVVGVGRRR